LAASNPPAYLGAMVGGGASGATSQLTFICLKSKEAKDEKDFSDNFSGGHHVYVHGHQHDGHKAR